MTSRIHIIGAGLAGSECAWQLAQAGVAVTLHEMRPHKMSPAHKTPHAAELVCSNSFRSDDDDNNAVGQLKWEMRRLGSLIMDKGDAHKVPAGGAAAVDRDGFAMAVHGVLEAHPLITFDYGEVTDIPDDWAHVVIATGPLTSDPLAKVIQELTGADALAFFDAIAPIVYTDSINFDIAWYQSRYDKGEGADYINCPLDEDQYNAFIDALLDSPKHDFKDWEKDTPYFDGCMPIEVMAERGRDTPRFGPMKPVGLTNPKTGKAAHAVVQLRQDNAQKTLYNLVGFQTKTAWGAQKELFRMIPGLENAEFARLGGLHRNTFINSPSLLDEQFRLKTNPRIRFAGQITGCEGYVESAAVGLMVGRMLAAEIKGKNVAAQILPRETALGALAHHITGGAEAESFQPMNINFGLFPPLTPPQGKKKYRKGDRKLGYTQRAKAALEAYCEEKLAA